MIVALIVAVIGLVFYANATNDQPKRAEISRITYAMGLLVFLLSLARIVDSYWPLDRILPGH